MKTLSTLALVGGLAACSWAMADSKDVVATFLDDRAAVVVRVRLDAAFGEVEPMIAPYRPWLESLRKAGARELFVIATLDELPPLPRSWPFAVVPLEEGADAKAIGALMCGGPEKGGPAAWTTCASIRGAVLAGDDATLDRAKAMTSVPRPDLAAALDAAGNAPVALAVATPEDLRRAIDEQVIALPEELGGGPASLVSRGLKWASVALRPGDADPITLLVQAAGADEAEKLLAAARKGIDRMRGSSAVAAYVPEFGTLADSLAIQADGDRITARMLAPALTRWVRAVSAPVEDASGRRECLNNLKNIGLAMHNYHSRHDGFPPSHSSDANGKPLLSWRVLILPYLDANDLYKEFHLDEPWDSPHNKALIPRMPKYLACPSTLGGTLAPGMTIYKRPIGQAIRVDPARGTPLHQVTDGPSATIMVLESPVDQAVEWTRPADWEPPADLDPKSFLIRHVGGANSVFMDGAGLFLGDALKPEALRSRLTPSGGEVAGEGD